MNYQSTRDSRHKVSTRRAVELGLAMDGGLFIQEKIERLTSTFWKNLQSLTYQEMAWQVMYPFFGEDLSSASFQNIIDRVCAIPVPIAEYEDRRIVELFHGPTLAFKDIGASFMAGLLREYQLHADHHLHVLVATSGDTGGAVAHAFHQVEGILVTILYPKGKVSTLQEQQMIGLGENIRSLAVEGTFDDCQSLVKSAFQDRQIRESIRLTSANSINVARWIPQCLPYIEVFRKSHVYPEPCTFIVPCGNLGNLSAGLLSQTLGLPVSCWQASSNANDSFIQYLNHGQWRPQPAVHTLAPAMDVGLPNNLDRLNYLRGSTWNNSNIPIRGISANDKDIGETILQVYRQYNHIIDPHTATAWHACNRLNQKDRIKPIIIGTAHALKFDEIIHPILGMSPEGQSNPEHSTVHRTSVNNQYSLFKDYLLSESRR